MLWEKWLYILPLNWLFKYCKRVFYKYYISHFLFIAIDGRCCKYRSTQHYFTLAWGPRSVVLNSGFIQNLGPCHILKSAAEQVEDQDTIIWFWCAARQTPTALGHLNMILFWESHWLYSKYRVRWCYRLCWPSLRKLFNGLVSYSGGPQALGSQCLMIWGGADIIIIEINCTVIVMCLNNPEIISSHSWFMEKKSSMKLVPGAKKTGDCCLKQHSFLQKMLSSWICRLRRIVLHVLRCGEHRNWCAGAMKQNSQALMTSWVSRDFCLLFVALVLVQKEWPPTL